MPEKVVLAYEEGAVIDFMLAMLDLIKDFSEPDLKTWIKDTYPDPEEIYG